MKIESKESMKQMKKQILNLLDSWFDEIRDLADSKVKLGEDESESYLYALSLYASTAKNLLLRYEAAVKDLGGVTFEHSLDEKLRE